MEFILASTSPARLRLLIGVGFSPKVVPTTVDERALEKKLGKIEPEALAGELARAKCEWILENRNFDNCIILGCDSIFLFESKVYGKPLTDEAVRERWLQMSGKSGHLITGHHLIKLNGSETKTTKRIISTKVNFESVTEEEIEAYIASGEPHQVAGAFTLDGKGSAFIKSIDGSPSSVIGLSVPDLRLMLRELDSEFIDFW